ncbi:MAG: InlB B-repeat-containing protein, partial [Bacteroidales bacterium]|nr:InlB B-repeat-containing protein [Bacteroidales bacterium]
VDYTPTTATLPTALPTTNDVHGFFYVRLKAGLNPGGYSGNVLIAAPTETAFTLPLSGQVTDLLYTVTLDGGNGVCAISSVTQTAGGAAVSLPLSEPLIADAGWTFVGWAESTCGQGVTTAPTLINVSYTPTQNTTLYAVYQRSYPQRTLYHRFVEMEDFFSWNNSYNTRTTNFYDGMNVNLASANHQSMTIKDMPVTKGSDVVVKALSGAAITALDFECKQWGNNAQTITLHTSSDGGATYQATTHTSSNFRLAVSGLENVNAVKFTFSESNNQIGLYSISLTCAPVTCYATAPFDFEISSGNRSLSGLNLDEKVAGLTIADGAMVTVTNFTNTRCNQLLIADGAQFHVQQAGVKATVAKAIEGYDNQGGYQLTAAPMTTAKAIHYVQGDYDLYYYDEPTHYWMNYKHAAFDFTKGLGYLYANAEDCIVLAAGELNAGDVAVALTRRSTEPLPGFNLVGNPYTHAIAYPA